MQGDISKHLFIGKQDELNIFLFLQISAKICIGLLIALILRWISRDLKNIQMNVIKALEDELGTKVRIRCYNFF